jgi:tetratricopeptide (TPR) repeat protein
MRSTLCLLRRCPVTARSVTEGRMKMKPSWFAVAVTRGLLCAFAATQFPALSQTSSVKINSVSEPPELTGEPKKVEKATDADRQLFEIIGHLKDADETKSSLPKLHEFITQHPGYSDAYFLRATCEACILNSSDFASISNDVEAAMSHPGHVYDNTDYYSLLGKIEFAEANYAQAINDLEKAMTRDLDTANRMFNIDGVEPQKTSKFCIWNLTDLNELVKRFPKDYRAWLFRGLYYEFFTTFKEDYFPKAMQEFQKAALLKPSSPLPRYYIGRVYSKASFWTKKAWASDEGRDQAIRNAAQAYTQAIQLDAKFLPAYEHRASAYLHLKQYSQALKDYDKILSLDPENVTAYSDRGLTKLDTGQYLSAIVDFGDAIRRKKDGDSYLTNLYENRGDAYVKLGIYRDAISDYSKAIALDLTSQSFLLSLSQIRRLYPEYDNVSDEVLCRKINVLFWPEFEYNVVAQRLMKENGTWAISRLNELYEKRGDVYLKAGDYWRGVLDFQRIFKGIPNFADSTDRWRMLGRSSDGEDYYLDVKSVEFSGSGPVRLWIKTTGKKQTETVAYEIDCKARLMTNTSTVVYDSNGKVLNTSELSSGWQRIVPDTIGEQLYNGACSSSR